MNKKRKKSKKTKTLKPVRKKIEINFKKGIKSF
jgi:hypothetical protein